MRILIAGCWRSGTTALYNLVRVICMEHGKVYSCFEDDYKENIGTEYDFEIVKVHKYKIDWVEWSDCVFTVFREPQEVLDSMTRFGRTGGRKLETGDALRGLAYWGHYQMYSAYCVNYAQIKKGSFKMVTDISKAIGVKVYPPDIIEKWAEIKPPKTGFDPVTLLHSNHITK